MTSNLRFVLDTNILVSAVIYPNSPVRKAFDRVLTMGRVLQSEASLDELDTVFHRPKFDRYVSLAKRIEFLDQLREVAVVVPITVSINVCRDPKDNRFLELAVSGEASTIISGDDDLLSLTPFRSIDIVTPAAFLASTIK